jgi:Reverse transcriptase (RNA-dependent DNA polymerase)
LLRIIFMQKKDGKLQPVQDYHNLNKWTVPNKYPLPLIPDLIHSIARKMLFTKFDVQWGYNNIPIKPGDEWKAAFKTSEGLFEPTVMFFGLTNSPAMFQTMMDDIFQEEIAQGWVKIYMDDIIITVMFCRICPHTCLHLALLCICDMHTLDTTDWDALTARRG